MTIAEVSKKYDITPDTLRYYEKEGLIPTVNRNASGIRDYTSVDCDWVKFIKCMRSAGMPIHILRNYVALFQKGDATIQERKQILIKQRQTLLEKKKDIEETIERLDYKIEKYEKEMVAKEHRLQEKKV